MVYLGFPIKNGGSFHSYVKLPEGTSKELWSGNLITMGFWGTKCIPLTGLGHQSSSRSVEIYSKWLSSMVYGRYYGRYNILTLTVTIVFMGFTKQQTKPAPGH